MLELKSHSRQKAFIIFLVFFLFLICTNTTSFSQTFGTIKGQIVEEGTDTPLIGANVMILGTDMGAASDQDGKFIIKNVPPGQYTLQVRYIGYKTQKKEVSITANEELKVNFSLKVDVLKLNEIVVTGMGGSQIKEKLGVTISKVDPTEIVNSDEGNLVSALAGKVANVEVTTMSGEPGASAYIRIRGQNTISGGTQPLFIVDGTPIDNSTLGVGNGGTVKSNRSSDINPEDIASVEVLKGAAAAAIYGSRAANGVVIITTKSGQPGKTRITYKTSYSLDEVYKSVPLQREYGQGNNGEYVKDYLRSWGAKLEPGTPTYDHAMEMFDETGYTTDNTLTISGGNNLTTYYASLGYIDQDGPYVGNSDSYRKYTFRLKGSHLLNEKFKVTGNLAYAKVKADFLNSRSNTGGITLGAWRTPPEFNNWPYLDPVTGLHRSYRYSTPTVLRKSRKYDNPYFSAYEKINEQNVDRVYGNVNFQYDPLKWISIKYTLGGDYYTDNRLRVNPVSSVEFNGAIYRNNYQYHEVDHNLIATFELEKYLHRLSPNVSGTFIAGYNFNSREYAHYNTHGDYMIVPGYNQLDNCVTITANDYEYLIHTESFFGQATFDLYNQLYLTAALRNDGSSTFGENDRRHWFPKFSSAWQFTKFKKMPLIPYLNFGKVRFAYGEAGVQPAVYSTFTGYTSGFRSGYWAGDLNAGSYDGIGGFYSSSVGPALDLKPERTKEYEAGIELGFFDYRLGLDVTYYKSRSEDVLFTIDLPPSTGYSSRTANGAIIENKGWEVDLNVQPIRNPKFTWDLGFLWATNDNICVDMKGARYYAYLEWSMMASVAAEGYPLGQFYGTDFVRFGRGSQVTLKDGTTINIDEAYPNAPAGAVYINEDGYPIRDPQKQFLKDPNPDWTGSIRNEFTLFGKVKISSLIDIRQGGYIWNGTKGQLISFGTHEETLKRGTTKVFEGYGPGAGKEVVLDQNYWRGVGNNVHSQFLEDGSYVKLREIAISYKMKNNFVRYFGLNDIDVRLSARNLKTWTDYTGVDPETSLRTDAGRGMDYFNMPNTRSYVLTLRFNY